MKNRRTRNHQVDSLAVRQVISHFNENWMVRNLDERDYGIDLTMERFDEGYATGEFVLVVQVKGTEKEFHPEEVEKFSSFPTATLHYAELFNIPFFAFYTSITSKETRFVWLQKYIELELSDGTWRNQDNKTIYFPAENKLPQNFAKLETIVKEDRINRQAIKFISLFEELKFHSESVVCGQFEVGEYCKGICGSLVEIKDFIDLNSNIPGGDQIRPQDLIDIFNEIMEIKNVSTENRSIIEMQVELLEVIKECYLNRGQSEFLEAEMTERIFY